METEASFVDPPVDEFVDRRRKVWLECTGEPYDLRAVSVLQSRSLVHDILVLRFVCPHCGKKHSSLVFN